MTKQEVFARAWRRAKTPKKCEDASGEYWLHHDGQTSFVGAAIDSDVVRDVCRAIDESSVTRTLEPTFEEILKETDIFDEDVSRRFLTDLEQIHDNCEPHEWERELRKFAAQWSLKIPSDSKREGGAMARYLRKAFAVQ